MDGIRRYLYVHFLLTLNGSEVANSSLFFNQISSDFFPR